MPQTYTTQWFTVSNGDVTTHNPQSLVETTNDIRLLDAEIQWEGVSETESVSVTDITGGTAISLPPYPDSFVYTQSFPTTSGTFTDHTVNFLFDTPFNQENTTLVEVDYTLEFYDNDGVKRRSISQSQDIEVGKSGGTYSGIENIQYDGRSDGYGKLIIDQLTYSGSRPDDEKLYLGLQTITGTTQSQTVNTTDPRVSRDVSGDATGITLADGEVSSWYSLSGLDPNLEEFRHEISGSNTSRFRFRFEWERKTPKPIKQLRVYDEDADTVRRVALADPLDTQLQYNTVRCYVQAAGQVLAVDMIDDPSDPNAVSSHRLYHPVHGTLYPRYYDTVT